MASKIQEEFVWLELKPQQRFKDDQENQVLKIIQYATEFAFFVFRNKSEMRLIVRTTNKDTNLFGTIDGLTVERIDQPHQKVMSILNSGRNPLGV
jgi:adenosine/AMP kinase